MPPSRIDGLSGSAQCPYRLGKYTLLARLAAGGMGEVYVAQMSGAAGFEKNVVVKRLLPQFSQDEQFIRMFVDEARLTARLSHPNICQVFELVEEGDQYYLAMEYLEGLPLWKLMAKRRGQGLDVRVAAGLVAQACEGLAHAHEFRAPALRVAGIIHRDVSPHNLMLTSAGLVKLLDFGVAKLQREGSQTVTGSAKGKYGYMSPEQIQCEPLDPRSDLFSLGVVLFELIAGKRLYRRPSDLATMQAIVAGERPRLRDVRPDVPEAVEQVVDCALSVDRDARFATARAFAEHLTRAVRPLGGPASLAELSRFLMAEHMAEIEAQRARIDEAVSRIGHAASQDRQDPEPVVAEQPTAVAIPTGRSLPLRAPSEDSLVATLPGGDAPSARSSLSEPSEITQPAAEPTGGPARRSRPWLWIPLAMAAAIAVTYWAMHQPRTGQEAGQVAAAAPAQAPIITSETPVVKVSPAQRPPAPEAPEQDSVEARAAEPEPAPEQEPEPEPAQAGADRAAADPPKRKRKTRRKRDTRARAPAGEPGYFTVDAVPYAEIYIDGRKVGVTPLVRLKLPAGPHTVRAVAASGQRKRLKIRIEPGKHSKRRIQF